MQVVVFGATGGTGRAVVEQALAQGIGVTAVVRDPTTFPLRHALLTVTKGDVMDAGSLVEPLRAADAVLSSIGVEKNAKTTLYSAGTAHILDAMRANGVKRFIGVTSANVGERDLSFPYNLIARAVRFALRDAYADMRRMEAVVEATSDLDWTLVRPARLTNAQGRGSYRTSTGRTLPGGRQLARADLAHLLLEALANKTYIRQHVAVAY